MSSKKTTIAKSEKETELILKFEPIIEGLGYLLRDLAVVDGSPVIVRITIEVKNDERAVNIADCTEVHKAIDPIFDVEDPFDHPYNLEVSSPGEKAPLRLINHFEKAVGDQIKFETTDKIAMEGGPMAARKNWKGVLSKVNTQEYSLDLEDQYGVHTIELSKIAQATWMRDWSQSGKKSAKPSKGPKKSK